MNRYLLYSIDFLRATLPNGCWRLTLLVSLFFCPGFLFTQEIPSDHVVGLEQLPKYLKKDIKGKVVHEGAIDISDLANYFREKFSERFFYDYRLTDERFAHYDQIYQNKSVHENLAKDHLDKYADSTQWKLPFHYLNGEPVNAYALRHLARQHKMVDIAFLYFYSDKDPQYIRYFVNQMRSLNAALKNGSYEKIEDGNGVYEVFRSGYRILNWLRIHNMFLGEEAYTDEDQLLTIATLLQHGTHLYERNDRFRSGNHQTRGMSALAMLSILLRDFEGTDLWYQRAMTRLGEHLDKEINEDGFQFERSVHYHMSDIDNYFYVYQLAKISGMQVSSEWGEKLQTLFSTLVKIAYPDLSAPVLQDDTEIPWGEKNDISGTLTLGYLLFEDPEFGYFANDKVQDRMYWFLQTKQLYLLSSIQKQRPSYGSLTFPMTHYYIMRQGWDSNDKMMVISAGLDAEKPDHQHGDMLGVQAMAYGKVILPNYQVRYSLPDFDLFKNSLVKNVALVDSELQGKEWTSNKGGSGFGKFRSLPNPSTIVWKSNDDFDLYVGSHDGFENVGVRYTRQVIFVKDDFWILKDNFSSGELHTYKQVWQGHYTLENGPNLIRSTFDDASGCDILQLNDIDDMRSSGSRGKQWTVLSVKDKRDFNFVTIVYPYKGYSKRIDESDQDPVLNDWVVNSSDWKMSGDMPVSITGENQEYFFEVEKLSFDRMSIQFSETTDVHVRLKDDQITFHIIGEAGAEVSLTGCGVTKHKGESINENIVVAPGDYLTCWLEEE